MIRRVLGASGPGLVLLGGWGAVSLYAWLEGGTFAWRLWAAVSVLLLTGLVCLAVPAKKVQWQRVVPARPASAGETPLILLRCRAPRYWPGLSLTVEEVLPPGLSLTSPPVFEVWPRRGDWLEFSYRLPPLARGRYPFSSLVLRWGDPFGFFVRRASIALPVQELEVWPRTVPLEGGQGSLPSRDPGVLRGVRPYQPGDRITHIHWAATAKAGTFYVREFEPPPRSGFWVVVDALPDDLYELGLEVAASLCLWAFKRSEPVGLLDIAAGLEVPPQSGPAQFRRLMHHLAGLFRPSAPPVSSSLTPADGRPAYLITSASAAVPRDPTLTVIVVGPGGVLALEELPTWLFRSVAQGGSQR
ncbi:MAG: DUF58 domain-containing protein [Firmicutes bacterium]|nr:DUF58 domain-containing protein [Bacillota bacterium]